MGRLLLIVFVAGLALAPAAEAALPTGATAGASVSLSFTVKNTAKKKAKSSTTVVVLSRDAKRSADDAVLARLKTPALKPSKSAKLAPKVTVPATLAPGTYQLLACPSFSKTCRVLVKAFAVVSAPAGGPPAPSPAPASNPAPPLDTPPAPAPPAPPAPTPPAPTTPAPTTPAPTTPAPTTPAPKTGIEISPDPIVLGALSPSATTDEWVAATRLVSVTNHGPGAKAIGPFFNGYQSGTITSAQISSDAYNLDNKFGCAYPLLLAEGKTCWVRLFWHPGNASKGVPLSGNLQGTFGVQVPNTATVIASVPVSADLAHRSYISGGIGPFAASSGYKYRAVMTVRNDGDVAGSFTTQLTNSPQSAGAFYQDPTRPGQMTCDGNLNPGESCTIPYAFCWGTATVDDERIRATVRFEGNSVNTTAELIASNRQSDPPQLCGGILDE